MGPENNETLRWGVFMIYTFFLPYEKRFLNGKVNPETI